MLKPLRAAISSALSGLAALCGGALIVMAPEPGPTNAEWEAEARGTVHALSRTWRYADIEPLYARTVAKAIEPARVQDRLDTLARELGPLRDAGDPEQSIMAIELGLPLGRTAIVTLPAEFERGRVST